MQKVWAMIDFLLALAWCVNVAMYRVLRDELMTAVATGCAVLFALLCCRHVNAHYKEQDIKKLKKL